MQVRLLTPLKNERDNIEKVWRAIIGQTLPPAEWVILDNGSTDGTTEWLHQQSHDQIRITILELPGKSLAQMMNLGIAKANFPIIASCHGGTSIPIDWLEHLLRPLQDEHVDVAAGTWRVEPTTAFGRFLGQRIDLKPAALDPDLYLPARRSMAFRKKAWEKVGGFPEWLPRFGEDTLFGIRLRSAGCRFAIAERACVGW